MIIAIVAFNGISPFHLAAPCVVFGETHPGLPKARLRICGLGSGPLQTSAGFYLQPTHTLRGLTGADMVIVPSWQQPDLPAPPALLRALQRAHARGARIVGLCLGAFVLAEAGLLDGLRASTHWECSEVFARRFPRVTLDEDRLYVDAGQVVTSAGTAAALDCCLHLLRQLHGADLASRVARRLVLAPHRQGGQAQFIEQALAPPKERPDRMGGLMDWLRAHLHEPHRLDGLAQRVHLSRRQFTRQFRQRTGSALGAWLLNERLALAQRLLESTELPMEALSARVGFGSAASLRAMFVRAFGVAPTQWRLQFRSPAQRMQPPWRPASRPTSELHPLVEPLSTPHKTIR